MSLDLAQKQATVNRAVAEFASDTDRTFSPDAFLLWIRDHRPELFTSVGETYLINFAHGYIRCAVPSLE